MWRSVALTVWVLGWWVFLGVCLFTSVGGFTVGQLVFLWLSFLGGLLTMAAWDGEGGKSDG